MKPNVENVLKAFNDKNAEATGKMLKEKPELLDKNEVDVALNNYLMNEKDPKVFEWAKELFVPIILNSIAQIRTDKNKEVEGDAFLKENLKNLEDSVVSIEDAMLLKDLANSIRNISEGKTVDVSRHVPESMDMKEAFKKVDEKTMISRKINLFISKIQNELSHNKPLTPKASDEKLEKGITGSKQDVKLTMKLGGKTVNV